MSRLIGSAFAAALAVAGAPAGAEVHVTADPACRVVRILPSGRRIVKPPSGPYRRHRSAHAAAAVASAGSGASRSVASVSSSSRGGHATASASSSTSGGRGRTVTTTHDENGCTVVIDDRRRGARR